MKGAKIYHSTEERLSRYVHDHGLRPSRVRNMVLEQVCALRQPFTARQLTEACAAERISVGTVYNVLDLLLAAQIIHATERQRGKAATEYEIISGTPSHMQIVCQKCGRVSEFNDIAVGRLLRERQYSNFLFQHYSIVVYGECKLCRKKKPSERQKTKADS